MDYEKVPLDHMADVLSKKILDGLNEYGFTGLLPFQEESIRSILKGENSIISAPTGSGKTEAFTIPVLQKISENPVPGVAVLLIYSCGVINFFVITYYTSSCTRIPKHRYSMVTIIRHRQIGFTVCI